MKLIQLILTNTKLAVKCGMNFDIEITTNIEGPHVDNSSSTLFLFYLVDGYGQRSQDSETKSGPWP